jgi:hypothetical protein
MTPLEHLRCSGPGRRLAAVVWTAFWSLLACLLTNASAQVTLISTLDTGGGVGWNYFNAYADMAAWSQTSTYSQVSVAALLNGGDGTTTGTFYLVNQVGSGTTPANEIARSSFSVTASSFSPQLVTLFTGLTLGPGTYYLVASGSGPGGWDISVDSPSPVSTAPDVSMSINNFRAQNLTEYPPANLYSSFYPGTYPYNLEYLVTSVPEPAPMALWGMGAVVFTTLFRGATRPRA